MKRQEYEGKGIEEQNGPLEQNRLRLRLPGSGFLRVPGFPLFVRRRLGGGRSIGLAVPRSGTWHRRPGSECHRASRASRAWDSLRPVPTISCERATQPRKRNENWRKNAAWSAVLFDGFDDLWAFRWPGSTGVLSARRPPSPITRRKPRDSIQNSRDSP